MLDRRRQGSSPKLIRNALGLLHGIFDYGQRNGWCARNPCELVDKPRLERNADIRYLDQQEVDALVRAVPLDTPYGPSDRALFLTAAMTGLRQGELLALRWADIDWPAARVRVRRSYVRGEWGAPKSRRSSRSVPMADRVARESSSSSSDRGSSGTAIWCSPIPIRVASKTTPTLCAGSRVRSRGRASGL
jgi:integrase